MRRPTLVAAPNHRHVPAVGQLLGRLSPVQVDPVGLRSQQTYLAKEAVTLAFPVLQIGHRIVSIGLLCLLAAAVLSACGDDPPPPDSPPAVSAIDTPNAAPVTATATPTTGSIPATDIPFPTPRTAPASNIPFPSPTPPPTPDPAIEIMASAEIKMGDAGSAAFETSVDLEVASDGRTRHIPVTYVGDFRTGGYGTYDVTATTPGRKIESRVITLVTGFLVTTYVLDASSGDWDAVHGLLALLHRTR